MPRPGSALRVALTSTLRSPDLRRAQASFGLAWAGEWAVTVALAVLAFRHGGTAGVGVVAAVRVLPAALLAPFAAEVVDRVRRERVLALVGVVRAVTLGGAALSLAGGSSPGPAYVLAAVATVAHTLFRPAHSALLPTLSRTPAELTTANVVRGFLDSASALLGPLTAGLLVGPTGVAGVFAVAAAAALWSAVLAARIDYETPPTIADAVTRVGPWQEALRGLVLLRERPEAALPALLFNLQTFTRGLMTVFTVVVALQLLDDDESSVGLLTAAFGVGAIVGSLACSLLVRSGQLARWLGVGVALWGVPFALLAGTRGPVLAYGLMALVGVANAVCDAAGFTLLQRVVPDEVAGRCFAALEALFTLTVAGGSLLAPGLVAVLGPRGALLAGGLIAPLGVALSWRRIRWLDAELDVADEVLDLLQRVEMLQPLPMATLAALGAVCTEEQREADTLLLREGDTGDDFFVVARGQVEVTVRGTFVRHLEVGDCFGEIAVLGACPRTSSVHARTPVALLRLSGPQFVRAVTGYTSSRSAADVLVSERLAATSAVTGRSRRSRRSRR